MSDLKTLLRELAFGVDYGKCKLAYDLYLNQLGLQLTRIEPLLVDYDLTKDQVTEMFAEHNILGFLPFIHFTSLCNDGTISKRELVVILFHMCEMSQQPPSLVYQIFSHIDSSITADMVVEADTLQLEGCKQFFGDHGILPILIAQYKHVATSGGNIYAHMIDVIVSLGAPEPDLVSTDE